MTIIDHRGVLYELSVLGDILRDQLVMECWDLSAAGGLLFVLSKNADGTLVLDPTDHSVPLDLLQKVAAVAMVELVG